MLTSTDWLPLLSPYLAGGYQQDTFEIITIDIQGEQLESCVRMTSYFISPTDEGGFHLSVPMALMISGQLRIIHGHWMNNSKQKAFETFTGNFSINCLRPIRDPDNINVFMKVIAKTVKPSQSKPHLVRAKYVWEIDFCDGAFIAEATSHFTFKLGSMCYKD